MSHNERRATDIGAVSAGVLQLMLTYQEVQKN